VLQGKKMLTIPLTGAWNTAFRLFFGDQIAEQMQSANPLLVMMLVPLFTLGIYPRLGAGSHTVAAHGLRDVPGGASFVIVGWLQQRIEAGEQLSRGVADRSLCRADGGEVLVSTTGLEFAFTQAAPEMKSTIMSFWLITVALGNALVSIITSVLSSDAGGNSGAVSSGRFFLYAGMTAWWACCSSSLRCNIAIATRLRR
jgi:POT family proton-dependent oligopeptide transporter